MSNHDEKDLLTQTLRERADGVGGGSLDLESVRGRARGIKRRRNAVRRHLSRSAGTSSLPKADHDPPAGGCAAVSWTAAMGAAGSRGVPDGQAPRLAGRLGRRAGAGQG